MSDDKLFYYEILSRLRQQTSTHPNISKLWIRQLLKTPTIQTCQDALNVLALMREKSDMTNMQIAALYALVYV